jgi:hypothetical protein
MENKLKIKVLLIVFIIGLLLSGITAFPLETELKILKDMTSSLDPSNPVSKWIGIVYEGLVFTNHSYPFISYGTDWLAFAHIVIAVAFIGPLKDPVRNIWVIEFGMIACVLIFPLAFIAGAVRGIPFFWQIIDCSFGAIGIIPLLICHRMIKQMEKESNVYVC